MRYACKGREPLEDRAIELLEVRDVASDDIDNFLGVLSKPHAEVTPVA